MKFLSILPFLFSYLLGSCQKDYTLDELVRLKWTNAAPGIEYFAENDTCNTFHKKSYTEINIKGITGNKFEEIEFYFKSITPEYSSFLIGLLNQYTPHSQLGYLKINFYLIFQSQITSMIVYMYEDPSKIFDYKKDSINLSKIAGIDSIKFISKEESKKLYLEMGNEDWSKVLQENPLPSSFRLSLAKKFWSEESLEALKKEILIILPKGSTVSYPLPFSSKLKDADFIFKYENKNCNGTWIFCN